MDWLIENDLGHHVIEFKKQKITEKSFLALTNEDLISLQVTTLGERKAILARVGDAQESATVKQIKDLQTKFQVMQAQVVVLTENLRRVSARLDHVSKAHDKFTELGIAPPRLLPFRPSSPDRGGSPESERGPEKVSEPIATKPEKISEVVADIQTEEATPRKPTTSRAVKKTPKVETPRAAPDTIRANLDLLNAESRERKMFRSPVVAAPTAFGRAITTRLSGSPEKNSDGYFEGKPREPKPRPGEIIREAVRSQKEKKEKVGKKSRDVSSMHFATQVEHAPHHAERDFFRVGGHKFSYAIELLKDVDYNVALSPPTKTLKLDHVYGFNCKDARNNLHYLKTGEYVYHVAAVVVIADPASNRQRFYCSHTDDVLSLTINRRRTLVASGQKNPRGGGKNVAFVSVWEPRSLLEVFRFSFHERGVGIVAFTPDGKFLLTAGQDDNHSCALWNTGMAARRQAATGVQQKPRVLGRLGNEAIEGVVFDPSFSDHGAKPNYFYYRFVAMVKNGYPKFFSLVGGRGDTDKVELKQNVSNPLKKKEKALVDSKFSSACFLKTGVCVVGGNSGTVYFIDRNLGAVVAVMKPCADSPITCLTEYAWKGQARVLACDAEGRVAGLLMRVNDGKVFAVEAEEAFSVVTQHRGICSVDVKKNVAAFGCPHSMGTLQLEAPFKVKVHQTCHHGETHGVHAHPSFPFFASVGCDRMIKVMHAELRNVVYQHHFPRHRETTEATDSDSVSAHTHVKHGFSFCSWSNCGRKLAVGTEDGQVCAMTCNSNYPKNYHKVLVAEFSADFTKLQSHTYCHPHPRNRQKISFLRFSPDDSLLVFCALNSISEEEITYWFHSPE